MTAEDLERDELDLARGALRMVDRLGNLSDEDLLTVMASGAGPGARQRQYLMHAGALALTSIAASLERIATALEVRSDQIALDLERIVDRLTYPDGRPPAPAPAPDPDLMGYVERSQE